MADYDAFLLVSFGGPEGPDDVMPFLQNVTRGRGIPPERLEAVAEHYDAVGGISPINQQCRDLIAAIGKEFASAGVDLPIYWGNRNWDPYLTGTVAEMAAAGVRRALAFVTSAYGSYSSCRQYLDDIERARAEAGPGAPQIDKIRHFYSDPGFIEPFADATLRAIRSLPPGARQAVPLVFTAHSVPEAMAAASGPPPGGRYPAQLAEAARLIAERVNAAADPAADTPAAVTPAADTPAADPFPGSGHPFPGRWKSRPGKPRAAGIPGGWSTRAAAGRPRSPGLALTCVTTWRNWPGTGRRARSWSRSASSPTTWRSCTTWTPKRPGSPAGWGCPWPGRPPPAPTRDSCR